MSFGERVLASSLSADGESEVLEGSAAKLSTPEPRSALSCTLITNAKLRETGMARVKLKLAGLEVEFADRDRALAQAAEWAERGTWQPIVVFGPEGCGKTSWLKQTAEILKSLGSVTASEELR